MSQPELRCTYCGTAEDLISREKTLAAVNKEKPVCRYCGISQCVSLSEAFGRPTIESWLNWLKRNDPTHWENILSNDKESKSGIAILLHNIEQDQIE